jgi:hypothetical protein
MGAWRWARTGRRYSVHLATSGDLYVIEADSIFKTNYSILVLGRFVDDDQFQRVMASSRVTSWTGDDAFPGMIEAIKRHNVAAEVRRQQGQYERAQASDSLSQGWREWLDSKPARFAGAIDLKIDAPPARDSHLVHHLLYFPSTLELVGRAEDRRDPATVRYGITTAYRIVARHEVVLEALRSVQNMPTDQQFRAVQNYIREAPGGVDGMIDRRRVTFESWANEHPVRKTATIYGGQWRQNPDGPSYRVGYVPERKEVFIADNGGTEPDLAEVHVLGHAEQSDIQQALAGWQDFCNEPGGLTWCMVRLFGRARELGGPGSGLLASPTGRPELGGPNTVEADGLWGGIADLLRGRGRESYVFMDRQ